MKTYQFFYFLFFSFIVITLLSSCEELFKDDKQGQKENHTKNYSADVAKDWFTLHVVKLTRTTPGYNSLVSNRSFAYTGLTLYESVVPGMKEYQSLASQLNNMPVMPMKEGGLKYHWPTCANSALASITRSLFPNTSDANKATIDSLELAYNTKYQQNLDQETFNRSMVFGKQVADAIFEWSKSDGGHEAFLHNIDENYSPPVGDGLWIPTPPAFGKPIQPHWGNNRSFLIGVVNSSQPEAPLAYSEEVISPFYTAAYELFTIAQTLTSEQTTIAKYWNDSPVTYNVPGHATHILTQILQNKNENLAKAAIAYAMHGLAINDASISCFKTKYQYNLVRPVSYIQSVISKPDWNPIINTPPHPEYSSAHAVISGASAEIMKYLFGNKFAFIDNSYVSTFGKRSYTSFDHYAQEAALSRVYGGIHYRFSCEIGLVQGKKVGQAINSIKFKKTDGLLD